MECQCRAQLARAVICSDAHLLYRFCLGAHISNIPETMDSHVLKVNKNRKEEKKKKKVNVAISLIEIKF